MVWFQKASARKDRRTITGGLAEELCGLLHSCLQTATVVPQSRRSQYSTRTHRKTLLKLQEFLHRYPLTPLLPPPAVYRGHYKSEENDHEARISSPTMLHWLVQHPRLTPQILELVVHANRCAVTTKTAKHSAAPVAGCFPLHVLILTTASTAALHLRPHVARLISILVQAAPETLLHRVHYDHASNLRNAAASPQVQEDDVFFGSSLQDTMPPTSPGMTPLQLFLHLHEDCFEEDGILTSRPAVKQICQMLMRYELELTEKFSWQEDEMHPLVLEWLVQSVVEHQRDDQESAVGSPIRILDWRNVSIVSHDKKVNLASISKSMTQLWAALAPTLEHVHVESLQIESSQCDAEWMQTNVWNPLLLENFQRVKALHIQGNQWVSADALIQFVERSTSLQRLEMDHNPQVDSRDWARLIDACNSHKIRLDIGIQGWMDWPTQYARSKLLEWASSTESKHSMVFTLLRQRPNLLLSL